MKPLSISMLLFAIAIFVFSSDASAQEIETIVTQDFTLNGTGWNKVFHYGDPITIFSYKQNSDIYSFGIYSDDYAGVIDLKVIPFNLEQKQLKKLPKNDKKSLAAYTNKAITNAREKALTGKYRTIATNMLSSNEYGVSVMRGDSITVIGYREERGYVSSYYYYAVVKNNTAGICYNYVLNNVIINNVPLPFLPSTNDPQVRDVIDKEKRKIVEREAAKRKAREEEKRQQKIREENERRLTNQKVDSILAIIEEENFANLRTLNPASIEVKGWTMDSAGGIAVRIGFTNCSSQTVKYVYFSGYFLNAVGDKCRNDITGSTVWKYRGVGPISPYPKTIAEKSYEHIASWTFGNPLFYSTIADKFRLSAVTIEYMNGKKTILSGAELKKRVKYLYE